MTIMKWVLAGPAAVVALVIAVPYFIDWNWFKPQLIAAVEDATGHELSVEGDLRFGLLPSPRLSLSGVRVEGFGADPEPLMAADRMSAAVELLPLFSRNVIVKYIALDAPRVRMVEYADGSNNWALVADGGADSEPSPDDGRTDAGAGGTLAVKDFRVRDGAFYSVNLADGSDNALEDVNADISVESLEGPFAIDGSMRFNELPLTVKGALAADGSADLLVGLDDVADLRFDGRIIAGEEGAPAAVRGAASADVKSISDLLALFADEETESGTPAPAMKGPAQMSVQLGGTTESLVLSDLTLAAGATQATGALRLDLAGARPQLAGDVRIDRLVVAEWQSPEPPPADADPLDYALPEAFDADVTVSIARVETAQLTLQDIAAPLTLSAGVLRLGQTRVALPGEGQLLLAMTLQSPNERLQGSGSVQLQAPRLRQTLKAMAIDPAMAGLARAQVRSDIRLGDGAVRLDNLSGMVDETRFSGALRYGLAGRGRVDVALRADTLDLARYAAREGAAPAADADGEPLPDVHFDVAVDTLNNGGSVYRGLAAKGVLTEGDLSLEAVRLADVAGHALVLTGRVRDVQSDMTLDLAAQLRGPKADGAIDINGALDDLTLAGAVNLAGAQLALDGTADVSGDAPRFAVSGTAKAAELAQVLAALSEGAERRPNIGPLDMAFALNGAGDAMTLEQLRGRFGPVDLTGSGTLRTGGARPVVDLTFSAPRLPLRALLGPADTGADEAAANAGNRWSKEPIDFAMLDSFDGTIRFATDELALDDYQLRKPAFELVSRGRTLELKEVNAGLWTGRVRFSGALDASGPVATARLSYALSDVSLAQLASSFAAIEPATGTLAMQGDYTMRGNSQRDMMASLAGTGRLAAQDGVVRRIDLPQINTRLGTLSTVNDFLRLTATALSGGQTAYRTLSADLPAANGVINLKRAESDMDGGTVDVGGTINLAQWTMDIQGGLSLADHSQAPPIRMTANGNISAPVIKYDTGALQRFFAVRFAVAGLNAVVEKKGFDPRELLGLGGKTETPDTPAAPAAPAGDAAAAPGVAANADGATAPAQPKPTAEEELRGLVVKGLGSLLGGKKKEEPAPAAE